jgi:hypothetical protein
MGPTKKLFYRGGGIRTHAGGSKVRCLANLATPRRAKCRPVSVGLEPTAVGLEGRRSTTELRDQIPQKSTLGPNGIEPFPLAYQTSTLPTKLRAQGTKEGLVSTYHHRQKSSSIRCLRNAKSGSVTSHRWYTLQYTTFRFILK